MKWVIDSEDDIGLSFWDIVVFWKYKYSVIIEWFPKNLREAPKYV